jgi:hypothetical protein
VGAMRKSSIFMGVLALLLAISSGLAAFEHNTVLSLENEVAQQGKTLVDHDTLITQLDTAVNLADSLSKMELPNASQYLATVSDQDNRSQVTKIFLKNAGASINYLPAYPLTTPWFNQSRPFSSLREYELTDNRSIFLSFWGWWFEKGGQYGGVTGGGSPSLNIGVTVRNDYAAADSGAPIGNRTGSYFSSVTISIRFHSWNGSLIEVPKNIQVTAPTASSNTAVGGVPFLLASGKEKEVIFYLSPSPEAIEAIDHCEIYVSSLLAY